MLTSDPPPHRDRTRKPHAATSHRRVDEHMRPRHTRGGLYCGQRGGCAIEPRGLRVVDDYSQPTSLPGTPLQQYTRVCPPPGIFTKPVYGRSRDVPPRLPSSCTAARTKAELTAGRHESPPNRQTRAGGEARPGGAASAAYPREGGKSSTRPDVAEMPVRQEEQVPAPRGHLIPVRLLHASCSSPGGVGEAAALVLATQEFVASGGGRPSDRRRRSAASPGRTGSHGRGSRRGWWRSVAAASRPARRAPAFRRCGSLRSGLCL